jgi:hypothetical protein
MRKHTPGTLSSSFENGHMESLVVFMMNLSFLYQHKTEESRSYISHPGFVKYINGVYVNCSIKQNGRLKLLNARSRRSAPANV